MTTERRHGGQRVRRQNADKPKRDCKSHINYITEQKVAVKGQKDIPTESNGKAKKETETAFFRDLPFLSVTSVAFR